MMKHGDETPEFTSPITPTPETRNNPNTPFFLKNAVAIYTLLVILMKIKNTLGLEAMLEYIEHYQRLIERFNPDFKNAVKAAVGMMSVEKMYRDITENEKQ